MSGKSNMSKSNSISRQNSLHASAEEKIKFAGDDSKDRLYEPKQNKKMVRVLTVVIYVFSVSLAAIMLSLYYVFFWNPSGPHYNKIKTTETRDNDHVTNNTATALPRCLHDHVQTSPRIEETVTFPFQLDNTFSEANFTEDENNNNNNNNNNTSSLNESDHLALMTKRSVHIDSKNLIMLSKLLNDNKNGNFPK